MEDDKQASIITGFIDKLRGLRGHELLSEVSMRALGQPCFGHLDFAAQRLDLRGGVNEDSSSEEEEEDDGEDATVLSHSPFVAVSRL